MNKKQLILNKIETIIKEVSKDVLLPYYQQVQSQLKADGSIVTQAVIEVQESIFK